MNVDDKNIESPANLRISLGYSNQRIQQSLGDDSGTGANAGSRVDMSFVASDPLSELVWSPQNGLSLKCADGSFSNQKPFQDVGPSNMISGSSNNEHMTLENATTGILPLCGSSHDRPKTANNDQAGELKTIMGESLPKEDLGNSKREVISNQVHMKVAKTSGAGVNKTSSSFASYMALILDDHKLRPTQSDPISIRATDVGDGNHAIGMEIGLVNESHTVKKYDADIGRMQNGMSIKGHEESFTEKERENKVETDPPGISPLERLESTAENDLQISPVYNACGVATKTVTPESAYEFGNNSPRPRDDEIQKTLAVQQSPTNSGVQRYQIKGKAKALSDGNVNARISDEDDDGSHESVESCNSAGLFSRGKRRWSFEQQLIVGSKRVKRQIQERPGSSSVLKQDSSFMTWISNMMKGFLSSKEAPSCALTIANPNQGQESSNQNLQKCNRNHTPGSRTMGFQSIFQSLYCPKTKDEEPVDLNANCQTEPCKGLEMDNKMCDMNATPIACRIGAGNVYKRFWQPSEKFDDVVSGHGATSASQPNNITVDLTANEEVNRSISAVNKILSNLATCKEKDQASSNSSLSKHKTNSGENIDADPSSEGKTNHNFGNKNDPLTNLWITRFTSRTPGPLLNQDLCNKNTEAPDGSVNGTRLKHQLLSYFDSSNEFNVANNREHFTSHPQHVQCSASCADSSFGFCKIKACHDQKSTYKQNSILPSQRIKNSEAMSSVIARRVDALKHIIPSYVNDNAASATQGCFFCGVKGHHLRNCSEISDSELEDFLRNVNSYDQAGELPCICIRCFQLNHWAVACPNTTSRVICEAKCGPSVAKEDIPIKSQANARNKGYLMLSDCRNSLSQASAGKMKLNSPLFEGDVDSISKEKKLENGQITPLHNFFNKKVKDIPKGIFDTVKRLRLSRTDILKWMNSGTPHSLLDGFFLRLRLGKWEEGLGGTGYHVACITGMPKESSPRKSKTSIGVNVGGIKCLVESQYVSNHDFLEDELMAWWSSTLREGGKIPSEEDLRLKIKEKEMLGF